MSIPTEAVEAALLAMRGLNFYDYNDAGYIRAALEAAAPHMMADRKVMAGVLAAHQIKTGDRGMSPRCSCGWLGQVFGNDFREDFITHQADMLDVQQKATKRGGPSRWTQEEVLIMATIEARR